MRSRLVPGEKKARVFFQPSERNSKSFCEKAAGALNRHFPFGGKRVRVLVDSPSARVIKSFRELQEIFEKCGVYLPLYGLHSRLSEKHGSYSLESLKAEIESGKLLAGMGPGKRALLLERISQVAEEKSV